MFKNPEPSPYLLNQNVQGVERGNLCSKSSLFLLLIRSENACHSQGGSLSSLIMCEVSVVRGGAGGPKPSVGLTRRRQRGRLP